MDLKRQAGLVPLKLRMKPALVVGAGTTGSWCAHTLLRMGWKDVVVVDADLIESHNAPAQFHVIGESAKGLSKVEGVREAMHRLGLPVPGTALEMFPGATKVPKGGLVFSCVDNIDARKAVAEAAEAAEVHRLVDFRMGPEEGSVLFVSASGPMSWETYRETLERKFVPIPACGMSAMLTTGLAIVGLGLGHWIAGERKGDLATRLNLDVECGRLMEVES